MFDIVEHWRQSGDNYTWLRVSLSQVRECRHIEMPSDYCTYFRNINPYSLSIHNLLIYIQITLNFNSLIKAFKSQLLK